MTLIEVVESLLDISDSSDREMLKIMYMLRDSMSNLEVEVKVVRDYSGTENQLT